MRGASFMQRRDRRRTGPRARRTARGRRTGRTRPRARHGAVVVHVLAIEVRDHGDGRRTGARTSRRDSSASATRNWPWPRRAFVPSACTRPPTTIVGSSPPASSTAPDHGRGRGLAVRAADGDRVLHAHELVQHLGARDDRQRRGAMRPRSSGLSALHGRRVDDDRRRPATLRSWWPTNTRAPMLTRRSRDVAGLEVRARHAVARW